MAVLWIVRESIVFVTLVGDYPFHEIQGAVADAFADPQTPVRAPLLIDGRASWVVLTTQEIQLRSDWYRDLLEREVTARCAIVVGESEYRQQIVAQGIAPLQETGLPVRSFTQFKDAVAWLKAPEDTSFEDMS